MLQRISGKQPEQLRIDFSDRVVCEQINQYLVSSIERLCPTLTIQRSNANKKKSTTFEIKEVTHQEIEKAIGTLKDTSSGFDLIPPILIKMASDELVKPVATIVNESIRQGNVPNNLKVGKVTPIPKTRSAIKMDEMRPITSLPAMEKILEEIVYRQLIEYLETNKLLAAEQYGFRRNRSTEIAATRLSIDIRLALDKQNITAMVTIDLRRAFETVNHSLLLYKLNILGVGPKTLKWFESYLSSRTQIVGCSQPLPIKVGVPQGSKLGPILFLIMINDISEVKLKSKLLLYADDTAIYVEGSSLSEVSEILEKDLELIADWAIADFA